MPDRHDSARHGGARTYGMPDPGNRRPPGEEGFRGEESGQRRGRADLTHAAMLPDGNCVLIEEESGTAFAEMTGLADGRDPSEEPHPRH